MARWGRRQAIRDGLSIAGVAVFALFFSRGGMGYDFEAYWSVDLAHPYTVLAGEGAYHYAPPVLLLGLPFRVLPWPAAYWAWFGLNVAVLCWLCRSWTLAALAFVPVTSELFHGNIHLLLGGALVLGLRHPGGWVLFPLTKVTTAAPWLWWVARADWRSLGRALAMLAVVVGVSFAFQAGTWIEWAQHLAERTALPPLWGAEIGIPVLYRLPFALALVIWAARTGRAWALAPALALSLPLLFWHGLAVLAAAPALARLPFAPPGQGSSGSR